MSGFPSCERSVRVRPADPQHYHVFMDWKPMDSAPHDGTPILLLSERQEFPAIDSHDPPVVYEPRVHVGRWYDEGTSWDTLPDGSYGLVQTGVWASGGGWFEPNEVTHWMPFTPEPCESCHDLEWSLRRLVQWLRSGNAAAFDALHAVHGMGPSEIQMKDHGEMWVEIEAALGKSTHFASYFDDSIARRIDEWMHPQ